MVRKIKAQSIAEYALLLSIVIAAAMGMQNEIRKALQARYYDAGHFFVRQTSELGNTYQYEPATGVRTTTNQRQTRSRNEFYRDAGEISTNITETSSADFESTRTE